MAEKNPNKPPISLYDWLVTHDLLEWTKPLWQQGGWKMRQDGKLYFDAATLAIETPWRHIKQAWQLDCGTWHRLIFDYISQRLPAGERFVPSRCHQCWKVVVRPQSLKQLFALENLQEKMQYPSKCGIEVRPTVFGNYGGYFYNTSLEEGCEKYLIVRKAVNEDKHLGPDVPVILKRGCTEFEIACGPSDKWEVTEQQLEMERLVDRWIVKDDIERVQPDILVHYIHKKWIEYAFSVGDKTYLEFTNNRPLTKAYITYHHLAEDPNFPNNIRPSTSDEVAVNDGEGEQQE